MGSAIDYQRTSSRSARSRDRVAECLRLLSVERPIGPCDTDADRR